jgi:hypothetical protein
MEAPYCVTADIHTIPYHSPAPGFGFLPINAFLVRCKEAVLVDTGAYTSRTEFLTALWSLIDPEDLKWVFMTHEDGDHAGALEAVLQAAPNARLVTNFLGIAKLVGQMAVPLDRVFLVNPGHSLLAGDREFVVSVPPLFDSGCTMCLFDTTTRVYFSADAFGALIPTPVEHLTDLQEKPLRDGFATFNLANSPWLPLSRPEAIRQRVAAVRTLRPSFLCSAHLPLAAGDTDMLYTMTTQLTSAELPQFPDQQAFETMLAQAKTGQPPPA